MGFDISWLCTLSHVMVRVRIKWLDSALFVNKTRPCDLMLLLFLFELLIIPISIEATLFMKITDSRNLIRYSDRIKYLKKLHGGA